MMEHRNRKEIRAAYKGHQVTGGICAVKNIVTGKTLLISTVDVRSWQNRFAFSQETGSCVNLKLQTDWKEFGAKAFVFEVLEELEKKETQTPQVFSADIKALGELWLEKLDADLLY